MHAGAHLLFYCMMPIKTSQHNFSKKHPKNVLVDSGILENANMLTNDTGSPSVIVLSSCPFQKGNSFHRQMRCGYYTQEKIKCKEMWEEEAFT